MYQFKIVECKNSKPHDWSMCPFVHPGERARRRDPRRFNYASVSCPEFTATGSCARGDWCPYAHGIFEYWLHPSRYRVEMCKDGAACKRPVCFFAHRWVPHPSAVSTAVPRARSVCLGTGGEPALLLSAQPCPLLRPSYACLRSLPLLVCGLPATHFCTFCRRQ